MANERRYSPACKWLAILMTVVCLWGTLLTAFAAVLGLIYGVFDSKSTAQQSKMFFTEHVNFDDLSQYIATVHKQANSQTLSDSEQIALSQWEERYSPQNTNLRFIGQDKNMNEILSNVPEGESAEHPRLSASFLRNITVQGESYYVDAHFDDYTILKHTDLSSLLNEPDDYDLWYYKDDALALANENGFPVVVRYVNDRFTITMPYATASTIDFTTKYGRCEWSIEADSNTAAPNDPVTVHILTYTEEIRTMDISEYYVHKADAASEFYSDWTNAETLPDTDVPYYVTAQTPAIESKLQEGFDIRIVGTPSTTSLCHIIVYLPETLTVQDTLAADCRLYQWLIAYSDRILVAFFVFVALTVLFAILMGRYAGHTADSVAITPGKLHTLPYELFWLLPTLLMLLFFAMFLGLYGYTWNFMFSAFTGTMLFFSGLLTLLLYTSVVRIKTGTLCSSCFILQCFRHLFHFMFHTKWRSLFLIISCLLLFILNVGRLPYTAAFNRFIIVLIDIAALLYLLYKQYAYAMLHKRVQRMEQGDFRTKDTPVPLYGLDRDFDNRLDHITASLHQIVENQTKAERMRAELITNVSHDLKTPLTSIVNYVDLLSREPLPTEQSVEYVEVLKRQSARLKKLTMDLVEASKASSGSLQLNLQPTDMQVLLTQLIGEYSDKLEKSHLALVADIPETPMTILADGRYLWRIFDNLMNNIYKYAMPNTRVYADVAATDTQVTIVLKNVSNHALNISPDELTERFVRGDGSRNSEGSGLGLSIAKDLTHLQNGTLQLEIDGDLFKAALQFPLYTPPQSESS